jgi:hypothetical protein
MGAGAHTKGDGSFLFFDGLVKKADMAVYRFVCGLRNAYFLFCRLNGFFRRLGNMLEEYTCCLAWFWLERHGTWRVAK